MNVSILSIVGFAVLLFSNVWGIIFISVPTLRENNSFLSWLCLGLYIAGVGLCSMQLGVSFYILSTN